MMAVNEIRHNGNHIAANYLEQKALVPYASLVKERCPHKDLLRYVLNRASVYVRDADRLFEE